MLTMSRTTPSSGWWEQRWYGRQPMEQLRIAVAPPRIEGAGIDCIGSFVLSGSIEAGGNVTLQKSYVGKHDVAYDGHYDGEGRLWGTWTCGPDSGRWMITLRHASDEAELPADIAEITPGQG
jgi:hypothetical protein